MNYRHAFHAGNFADCMKHALLVDILHRLRRKEAGFAVLDTHAGPGDAALDGDAASRTGEWRAGIGRLDASADPVLADYLEAVAAARRTARSYPGSPLITRALLRAQDRLIACELHPDDAAALKACLGNDRSCGAHARDGYAAIAALLPPNPQKRGLVLIDPPFERPDEFDRLAEAIARARTRFPTGIVAAWYPVKHLAPVRAFHHGLQAGGLRDLLACELHLRAPLDPARLNGSGMVVANPPYGFEESARTLLASLLAALRLPGDDAGAGSVVRRIAEE